MKQQPAAARQTSAALIGAGIALMLLLTATKVVPSSNLAGYSVFVGIVFFFLTEAASKTRGPASGLRFATIAADLKKPGVAFWMLLPTVSGIATLLVGGQIFGGAFVAHVMGRTGSILSFDQTALLAGQVILAAFGEEIAYRGFFFGKGSALFPAWACAVVSSAAFAAGHIAAGPIGIVAYDVVTIFLDSLVYSVIFHKTGNCVITTLSHLLCNAVSIAAVFAFF